MILAAGCKNNNNPEPDAPAAFDKKTLLESVADKIIIPNLKTLQSSTDRLVLAGNAFQSGPDSLRLQALRAAWDSAYVDFLHVNAFNFGPGEVPITGTLADNLGIWPVNVNRVEQRIIQKNYTFTDFERDSRGFQALDYLLFSDSALIRFNQPGTGPDRLAYLNAVIQHIQGWVTNVNNGWNVYRQEFIQNDGKDAGSSVSLLYNQFLLSYEGIKNFKLGLPAGLRAGQTQAEPTKTESYYSGYSTRHLKEHFAAIRNIWTGNARNGAEGIGFDDWLNSIQDGKTLLGETRAQFNAIADFNATFNDNTALSTFIQTDLTRVQSWYTEYQKFTRYLKSDLSSLIGIAITYSSGDGD